MKYRIILPHTGKKRKAELLLYLLMKNISTSLNLSSVKFRFNEDLPSFSFNGTTLEPKIKTGGSYIPVLEIKTKNPLNLKYLNKSIDYFRKNYLENGRKN